jgi:hypothetical protein
MYDLIRRFYRCPKCKGLGRLNWIEQIFGKDRQLTSNEIKERFEIEDKFEEEFFKKNIRSKECIF